MKSNSRPQKCLIGSCDNKLRVDNKSGYCGKHVKYGDKCKKCEKVIYRGYKYCHNCSELSKSYNAKIVMPCQFVGCQTMVHSKTRLCREHFYNYHKCESPGCENRVCFTSKYRLCLEHHNIAKKLKRMGIPEYPNTPHPITRKKVRNRILEVKK
jgi:hypothetical protein